MEIVLKDDKEHRSRLRVQKNKGIILRNVSFGGICIKCQYVLSRHSLLHRADSGRIWRRSAWNLEPDGPPVLGTNCVALGRLLNLSASISSSTKWANL